MSFLNHIKKRKSKILAFFTAFLTGVTLIPHNVVAEDEVFVSTSVNDQQGENNDKVETFDPSNDTSNETDNADEVNETNETDDEVKDANESVETNESDEANADDSTESNESANSETNESDKTDSNAAESNETTETDKTSTVDEGSNETKDLSTTTPEEEEEKPESNLQMTFEEYIKRFEDKIIVDIEFEGASDFIMPTVRANISQHVGDEFKSSMLLSDSRVLLDTGYFYDLYQTFEEVPEGVIIRYHLMENPVLQNIVFVGNTVMDSKELQKAITVKKGEMLNTVRLHENVVEIQKKYREAGYVLMKITDMNIDKSGILTLKINEGKLEGYKIKGNKKTRDKVILREMRQKPGDVFNANLTRRSMQRVNNLGFFEDVNVRMTPGLDPNAIILEINVKEKRTGTFGIGAGYSSEDGIIGMVNISDTNFRGTGDAISATYEISGDDEDAHGFTFSYRRPWLDDKETSGTFRFYNRTYEYDDYDTKGRLKEEYMRKYVGGEITLGRPVSEYSTNYVTLRNRKDEYVRHVSSGNAGNRGGDEGAKWRSDNFGITRSITLEHVTDTRDNIYNPTTGGRVNLSAEFGGLVGGDFDFQKYSIEHQQFFKAGRAQVWALRSKYGIGYGDISEFNLYRIGGQDTLRGYREDQFRGERMLLGTLEYRFPLFSKVQGALFTDWGSAWNTGWEPDDFHGSVGVGVALTTPLGPLRLDYGRGSQGGRIHFSVGGAF